MLVSIVIPVYCDAERACEAALALLAQKIPEANIEIILVDDGSPNGSASSLKTLEPAVRVLTLPHNQGRSSARNAGAAIAAGEWVVFVDCDCIPLDGFLTAHLDAMDHGSVANCGHVTGTGSDFWSKFQDDASRRRQRQHEAGIRYSGSSQNLAVRRSDFEAIGGFDTGYRHYGFEDRDLLVRLEQRGAIAWTTATVRHQDELCLAMVASKMSEAGQYSSRRFAERHPNAYVELRYASIDARLQPAMKPLAPCAVPIALAIGHIFDRLGVAYWLPYPLARTVVRLTSALAFLGGTVRSR